MQSVQKKWLLMVLLLTSVNFAAAASKDKANGQASSTDHTLTKSAISIEGAYVNVPIPGSKSTAMFFTLRNLSNKDLALVAVHTDIAKRIELHTHLNADGMMKMRKLEQVVIPAQSAVTFASGSYHVMLFDMQRVIQTGDQVPLVLGFNDGKKISGSAKVKSLFDGRHH